MTPPFINLEEKIDKVVGRRLKAPDPLSVKNQGGIDYEAAARDVVVREVDGVPILFASPRLLWRMKAVTHREKDAPDLLFLRTWFAGRGEQPPNI